LRSIRTAIVAGLAGGTAALLIAGAIALTWGARRLLIDQFDAAAASKLSMFAALFEQEGPRIELDLVDEVLPEFRAGERPEYFQVWRADDELARSPSLGALALPRRVGTEAAPETFDLVLPDGGNGRAIGALVTVRRYERSLFGDPGPAQLAIVLARDREELDRALGLLVAGTAGGIAVLVLGGLVLGLRVTDRGLAPVAELVHHVERIGDPTRAAAFPVGATPVELRPIAAGLNRLVERIGRLLERERRTSANVAHELRTPISELLTIAEVALRFGDAAEARRALEEVLEVGQQMRRLVGTLFELARLEAGAAGDAALAREPVDLAELVHACWEPLEPEARKRGIRLEITGAAAPVEGDPGALAILVSNLLGNAAEHAPEGSRVACALARDRGTTLQVSNPAGGLLPGDLDKLTEPFWRASAARDDRGHVGLGLALVRRLAEVLGVELRFALVGGELQARLGFPAGRPT
jgi:two-component system sensor histidine kinase QseC